MYKVCHVQNQILKKANSKFNYQSLIMKMRKEIIFLKILKSVHKKEKFKLKN